MANRGIFGRINDYFASKSIHYNMQKLYAERNAAAQGYLAHQDREFERIDNQPNADAFDKAMDKYAFRLDESKKAMAGNLHPDYAKVASVKDEIEITLMGGTATNKVEFSPEMDAQLRVQEYYTTNPNTKGYGIGAFFGRLFNGRFTAASRERGGQAFARIEEDTMYDMKADHNVYRLAKNEEKIRKGEMSIDDALKTELPDHIGKMRTEVADALTKYSQLRTFGQPTIGMLAAEIAKHEPVSEQSKPKRELDTDIDVVREKEQQIEKPEKEKVAMTPEELGDHKQEKKPEHKWVNAVMPTPESMTKKLNEQARAKGK